jgi:hypothetical protein
LFLLVIPYGRVDFFILLTTEITGQRASPPPTLETGAAICAAFELRGF